MSAVLGWDYRLDALACEIGRLRRRAEAGSSLEDLADRLACHLESLHLLIAPNAAELVAAGFAVDEALELVDRHVAELRARMGGKP